MRKVIYISLIAFFVLRVVAVHGQDIHLSQFYDSPLTFNPATAGAFAADYRLVTNYKNQWKSVGDPYKTIAASADMKIFKNGRDNKNYLGAGVTFLRDKAGKSAMGLMQTSMNISYKLRLADRHSLSSGVQVGWAKRTINTAGLKWDNQFDGNYYDPSRPSGEYGTIAPRGNLDLGAGMEYRHYNTMRKFKFTLGASSYHLLQPAVSFMGGGREPLARKYIGYTNAQIRMPKMPMYIIPQAMYTQQGSQKEIMFGANVKYVFGVDMTEDDVILNTYTKVSSSIQAGALYRLGDAIVVSAAVEMQKSLSIGVSYDLNISKLKPATAIRGGVEVSLIYKGFL